MQTMTDNYRPDGYHPEEIEEYWDPSEPDTEEQPKPALPPRFVIRDAAFAMQDRPPRDWLVQDVIEERTVSTVYGDPGSKKTYSMLHLAACVALGLPWLGFETKQRKVLYINEETDEIEIADRLKKVLRGLNADDDTPVYCMSLAQLKMDKREDAENLYRIMKHYGFGLVIVDALSEVMDGDENAKRDLQPVYSWLRLVTGHTGASGIYIHHPNKTGSTYRGSSVIKGSSDLLLKIVSEEESEEISFITEKIRNGKRQKWAAEACWEDGRFTLERTEYHSKSAQYSISETEVIRFLQSNGAADLDVIASHAEACTPGAMRKAVYSLASKGVTRRINKGSRGIKAIYDLTEEYKEHGK